MNAVNIAYFQVPSETILFIGGVLDKVYAKDRSIQNYKLSLFLMRVWSNAVFSSPDAEPNIFCRQPPHVISIKTKVLRELAKEFETVNWTVEVEKGSLEKQDALAIEVFCMYVRLNLFQISSALRINGITYLGMREGPVDDEPYWDCADSLLEKKTKWSYPDLALKAMSEEKCKSSVKPWEIDVPVVKKKPVQEKTNGGAVIGLIALALVLIFALVGK